MSKGGGAGARREEGGKASGTVEVRIPKGTAERVARRLEVSGFKSVDEYVSYVVEAVLKEVEGGSPPEGKKAQESFSKEDQESVEQKLRALGYM